MNYQNKQANKQNTKETKEKKKKLISYTELWRKKHESHRWENIWSERQ